MNSQFYNNQYLAYLNQLNQDFVEQNVRLSGALVNLTKDIKDKFLSKLSFQDLDILVTGSGTGGLGIALARLGAKIVMADYSEIACEVAQKSCELVGIKSDIFCHDLTFPDFKSAQKFDLIIDNHLLHCLPYTHQRTSYLSLVRENLKPHGLFLGESMVYRKKVFIPPEFKFDGEILWQMLSEWTAVRRISDSLDLEQEFKEANFIIKYFYYYAQYGVSPHVSFDDLPTDILPALVRFALAKDDSLSHQ